METISFDTIQSAIDTVCSITSEDQLDAVSQELFDAQPGLAGFMIEYIEDMSDGAKDLGFMMALVLWKSFQEKYPDIRSLSEDEVIALFEQQEAELEKLLQIDEEMIESMQKKEAVDGQPEVFNYMTQELFSDGEDEIELTDDEEVHLFMVLRFFANVLNDLAKETNQPLKH